MISKFHKKVNRVNMIHFTFQISWLMFFILTLPEDITRLDLITRLLVSFGGFTLLSFGVRHFFVLQSVHAVQERINVTEANMHRLLGLFDDFYGLAETHLESIRRIEVAPLHKELLVAQADEMVLRLAKTGSDVEKMKKHLRFEYLEKPPESEAPHKQKKRQFESMYFYR